MAVRYKARAEQRSSLAVQALIDGKVLCVHGGLSPDLRTLDQALPTLATLKSC